MAKAIVRTIDSEIVKKPINMYNVVWCVNMKLSVKHAWEMGRSMKKWNLWNPSSIVRGQPESRTWTRYEVGKTKGTWLCLANSGSREMSMPPPHSKDASYQGCCPCPYCGYPSFWLMEVKL
ncbi:hypothetical protein U1Q18_015153 [Sarracenia purpurea var. burkii]